jgi:hypothetical protein
MASSRNNTLEFSSAGSQILGAGDTATITRIGAIQVLNDAAFTTLTSSNVDQSLQVLTGATFPAGTVLYGQFSAVVLTSGLVACHKV